MDKERLKRANEIQKLILENEQTIKSVKIHIEQEHPLKSIGLAFGDWKPTLLTLPNLEKSLPLILINSEEELERLKKEFEEL